MMPGDLYRAAKRSSKISFFCPYGHEAVFKEGDTEADILRRERDKLKQAHARLEDEKREAEARAEKAERASARLKKRAAVGTCPCCTRTFTNMARHMQIKHPDWKAEAVKPNLKVVA